MGEAWFHVGAENQTQILQLGQALALPSFEVRVVSLDETTATVSLDGRLYRLAIGQNLAEAVPITGTPSPITGTPSQVTGTPSPVTETPSPVTGTPSPVTGTPSPVTETPSPVTETPSPSPSSP
jgi:hypothetical protein